VLNRVFFFYTTFANTIIYVLYIWVIDITWFQQRWNIPRTNHGNQFFQKKILYSFKSSFVWDNKNFNDSATLTSQSCCEIVVIQWWIITLCWSKMIFSIFTLIFYWGYLFNNILTVFCYITVSQTWCSSAGYLMGIVLCRWKLSSGNLYSFIRPNQEQKW
jgi:hypothetical protein